jgi:prefoldin subunit 5
MPRTEPPRRLTEPRPERALERVNARIERALERVNARFERLEDTNTHFYNLINELRERVSTLEKKLEHLHQ